jgi:hypothetical protein
VRDSHAKEERAVNRIVLTRGTADELRRIVAGAEKPLSLLSDFERALSELLPTGAPFCVRLGRAQRRHAGVRLSAWLVERPAAEDEHQFTSVPEAVAFLRPEAWA